LFVYANRPWGLSVCVVVAMEAMAWRAERRPTLRALVFGSVITGGSLWFFRNHIIYWYIVSELVPAGRVLRVVGRGLLLGLIPAAVGLACLFDQTRTRPKHLAAACALGLACFLEQGVTTPSTNKFSYRAATIELARQVDRHCTSFYYSPHHPQRDPNQYHVDAMWAQMETGVPTINGYSGASPPGWTSLYYLSVNGEIDIDRLGQALGQWAGRHRLQPGEICWIGGRNDAIVSGSPPQAPRQAQEDHAQHVEPPP
jgi:hypothetical protein